MCDIFYSFGHFFRDRLRREYCFILRCKPSFGIIEVLTKITVNRND